MNAKRVVATAKRKCSKIIAPKRAVFRIVIQNDKWNLRPYGDPSATNYRLQESREHSSFLPRPLNLTIGLQSTVQRCIGVSN
jgi:hypothetical protein